jgi:hypothetical protein
LIAKHLHNRSKKSSRQMEFFDFCPPYISRDIDLSPRVAPPRCNPAEIAHAGAPRLAVAVGEGPKPLRRDILNLVVYTTAILILLVIVSQRSAPCPTLYPPRRPSADFGLNLPHESNPIQPNPTPKILFFSTKRSVKSVKKRSTPFSLDLSRYPCRRFLRSPWFSFG